MNGFRIGMILGIGHQKGSLLVDEQIYVYVQLVGFSIHPA